jgi:hypothetical protein
MPTSKRQQRDEIARRPGRAGLALRLAGASYAEIADTLALADAAAARDLVVTELAARDTDPDQRNALRVEEEARILRLLRGVWGKATDPTHPEHLPAARIALSMVDRHAKLMGLDMPTEVVVYTPTTTEIETWVAAMVSRTDVIDVEEADILAIEA